MLWLITQLCFARDYTVILQSDDYPQYEIPATSFLENSDRTTKRYQLHGKKERAEHFGEILAADPPPLVIAFGAKAAWTAQKYLPDVPLLYAMVENPSRYGIDGPNTYGISMIVPQDLTLSQLVLDSRSEQSRPRLSQLSQRAAGGNKTNRRWTGH